MRWFTRITSRLRRMWEQASRDYENEKRQRDGEQRETERPQPQRRFTNVRQPRFFD